MWRCFANLHRARLYGLGPMGIQTSEIVSWLDLYRIEGETREIIYELIVDLDEVWMNWQAEKKKDDG